MAGVARLVEHPIGNGEVIGSIPIAGSSKKFIKLIMTFPLDIHIGIVVIPIHLLTDVLSFYLGYRYYIYLRKREGDHVGDEQRFLVIIGAALGALIGSRLLASLENMQLFLHPPSFLYYYVNKTIVGALIGGILGVEICKKIIGQKTATGDIFVFPLIFAIAFGRIGCLLTGVTDGTVGNPSNLPWAFDQGDGIARHPTALYEIIFLVVLFFLLKRLSKKFPLKQGVLFRIFVISYLLFRFLIEFIKPVEQIFIGLSAIQIASLLFALYYIYTLLFVFKYRPFARSNV